MGHVWRDCEDGGCLDNYRRIVTLYVTYYLYHSNPCYTNPMHEARPNREFALYRVALARGGLFRYDEAKALGFSRRAASYRAKRGEWERVGKGLYRLSFAPRSPDEDLIRIALWAKNPWGPVAFSLETALHAHGLTNLIPSQYHLTVPTRFDRKPPKGVSLHRADLSPEDLDERPGYLVTSPLRTLLDVARSPRIAPEHLEAAIDQAIDRGLVTYKQIDEASRNLSKAARRRLKRALAAMEPGVTGT